MNRVVPLMMVLLISSYSYAEALDGYYNGMQAGSDMYSNSQNSAIELQRQRLELGRMEQEYTNQQRTMTVPTRRMNSLDMNIQRSGLHPQDYYNLQLHNFKQANPEVYSDPRYEPIFDYFVGQTVKQRGAIEPILIFEEAKLKTINYINFHQLY